MEPNLITRKKIYLVGMEWFGKLTGEEWTEANPIGQLWQRFSEFWDNNQVLIADHVVYPEISYELNIWNQQAFDETGHFATFVGVEVDNLDFDWPLPLVAKSIPPTAYAHLVVPGPQIPSWEQALYQEWLPQSGYRMVNWHNFHFQIQAYEDGRFLGVGDRLAESEIDVYVPVRPVHQAAVTQA